MRTREMAPFHEERPGLRTERERQAFSLCRVTSKRGKEDQPTTSECNIHPGRLFFLKYSRSPKNPALQQFQKCSKSASAGSWRPIWNSFGTVGVWDFWENGCSTELYTARRPKAASGPPAATKGGGHQSKASQ